jgi:hypothetical protein
VRANAVGQLTTGRLVASSVAVTAVVDIVVTDPDEPPVRVVGLEVLGGV